MRIALVVSLVLIVAAGLSDSAIAQTAPKPGAGHPPVAVNMTGDNLTFDPPVVTIRRGQTVEWQNLSRGMIHTVTADPKQAQNKANVSLPPGAKPFDSGYMKPGDSFRHTFTVRGTYRYVCITHEVQHMVGQVIVK
jgi:plastocyanin